MRDTLAKYMSTLRKGIFFAVSAVLTGLLSRYFNIDEYHNYLLYLLIFVAVFKLVYDIHKILNKRLVICSAVYSFFLTLSFLVGDKITTGNDIMTPLQWTDTFYFLALGLMIFTLTSRAIHLVTSQKTKVSKKRAISKKFWLIASIIMFVGWTPYFMAFFPGVLSPDSIHQLGQSLGSYELSNSHPVMHTVLVSAAVHTGMFIGGGSLTVGVAVYSLLQMALLSIILSYATYWVAKRTQSRLAFVMLTGFFTLNPVIATYSVTMWKDVLFGGIVLLLVIKVFDIVESKGRQLIQPSSLIVFMIIVALVAFFRNNGIFIVTILLIALLIIFKKYWRITLPTFAGVLMAILIIQGPAFNALGIQKPYFAESVGVPLQQIGRSAKYGYLSEEQKADLAKIIDTEQMAHSYIPQTSNGIKFNWEHFNDEHLNEHKLEFLVLWAQILPNNFSEYLKAYLMETEGLWHIGTTGYTVQLDITDSQPFNNTDLIGTKGVLQRILSRITTNQSIYNIVFNMGVVIWVMFLLLTVVIYKKCYQLLLAMLPIVTLWLTLMIAAPINYDFRYIFAIYLTVPILALLILQYNRTPVKK